MNEVILKDIQQKAFQYFMDYTNFHNGSTGYGLTTDNTKHKEIASIAATGFMLSALVIGVEEKFMTFDEGREKALQTLKTLYHHVPNQYGFFAHFLDIDTGQRHLKTEYSTIDTALALCGIFTVDYYFKDIEISRYAKLIFDRVDWETFIFERGQKKMLHMSYNPDKGGDYVEGKPGFIYQWHMFAEQLIMYVMAAGSKINPDVSRKLYQDFERNYGSIEDITFIHSPHNTLFVYHFPLAWLDLENIVDEDHVNWFENARLATLSHQRSAVLYQNQYKGFSDKLFGCNASDTPKGYRVFGALPNEGNKMDTDGTLAPFSMVGALPFLPEIAIESIKEMKKIDHLYGEYGFYDAFNMTENPIWISQRYISIDKGLEMLMVNAYLSKTVQKAFMSHPVIVKGMEVLGWK